MQCFDVLAVVLKFVDNRIFVYDLLLFITCHNNNRMENFCTNILNGLKLNNYKVYKLKFYLGDFFASSRLTDIAFIILTNESISTHISAISSS